MSAVQPTQAAQPGKPVPVLLDCDPGHDDAVAILLALGSPGTDLIGITTCFVIGYLTSILTGGESKDLTGLTIHTAKAKAPSGTAS